MLRRVALHKYDPEDLVSSSMERQQQPHGDSIVETNNDNSMTTTPPSKRIREMELAESKGLLVDFGGTSSTIRDTSSTTTSLTPPQMEESSPFSVVTQNSRRSLDFDEQVEDDSDDDLL